jgi:hypothetical protein
MAGYLTVNPTQNYLGQALSNVENSMIRMRAERSEEARLKRAEGVAEQETRRRDMKDSEEFNSKYPYISTGTGLDASNRQSVENAKTAYLDATNNYAKTGDKKYLAIRDNSMNSINQINEMPTALNKLTEGFVTNEAAYNPSSLKAKRELIANMSDGNIMQEIDAYGNPKFTMVQKDENGNVTKVLHQGLNKTQMMALLTPEKAFNLDGKDGLKERFAKNIGREIVTKKLVGDKEIVTVSSPGAEEQSKTMADSAVNDRSTMYDMLVRLGQDPENKENYDKYKGAAAAELQKLLMATAPTTVSESEDYKKREFELGVIKEANDQRQNSISNGIAQTKIADAKNDVTVTDGFDPYGQPIRTIRTTMTKEQLAKKQQDEQDQKQSTPIFNGSNPFMNGLNQTYSKKGTAKPTAEAKQKGVEKKEDDDARTYMSNGKLSSGTLKPENKIHHLSTTNKGQIGLYDEAWFDTKTRKMIPNNQVIGSLSIAEKAKASGYTEKEYKALLIKKGIYIIQN